MQTIECVICDIDGTLVDSNKAHARAWVIALAAHGYAVTIEQMCRLIGMGSDKLLPAVADIPADSLPGMRIIEERTALFNREMLPGLLPCPGAPELLHRIKGQGLKVVAASSARGAELEALLRITGAPELFDKRISSDDAARSKPDPDILQVALEQAGCPAERAVMLGDTPYDIAAAAKLGLGAIAFRTGGWEDDALAGALAIYDDPADLLRHYDESPLARALRHGE